MSDKENNLFVFHGCDRKVGTTMISHCAAKILSGNLKDRKILYAALNGNDDIHYSRGNTATIDSIKIRIDNNLITSEEMENSCARDGDLYVIGGISGVFSHRNYSPDFSIQFLNRALEIFDVVVADCGNELDSGLCVGALKYGGVNFLVINQNESSLVRFEKAKNIYSAIDTGFEHFVVNRYTEMDPHDVSYIRRRIENNGEGRYFTVREEAEYSKLAEIDEQLILDYKCPGFSEDMNDIVYEMMKMTGISDTYRETGRKRLFGFM
ncbi:MAG: hypothetical protein Q4C14_08215 [Bacillota bacterium]|nr:hypothetical protein [Bacillota bacterium]